MRVKIRATPQFGVLVASRNRLQRINTAGTILQRMRHRLEGGPTAGLAGVWLMAVDAGSVSAEVLLPNLRVFVHGDASETYDLDSSHPSWWTISSNLVALVLVLIGSTAGLAAACNVFDSLAIGRFALLVVGVCARGSLWEVAAACFQAELRWPGLACVAGLSCAALIRLGLLLASSPRCCGQFHAKLPGEPTASSVDSRHTN